GLVAPLRRRVLAAHRTRGGLAAAVAGPAARLSPAREPRGTPRRAVCRRVLRRAICPARCDRPVARDAAPARPRRGALPLPRRPPAAGALLSLSGADPLNLVGILTPGPRLPALTGNRLLYRDGLPIALLAAGEVQFLETLDAASEWEAHKALLRCAEPASPMA